MLVRVSTALVILNNAAPMSLCSICPAPGGCCSGFHLFTGRGDAHTDFTVWAEDWKTQAQAFLDKHALPYTPAELRGIAYDPTEKAEFGVPYFSCSHLTPEGRCGIWATRPRVCSDYVPLTDSLCKFPR